MPDWFKVFRKAKEIFDGAKVLRKQAETPFDAPRCYICGKPMRQLHDDEQRLLVWRHTDLPVFRCPDDHEFSPGNYAEGVVPVRIPPKGAGPGEI